VTAPTDPACSETRPTVAATATTTFLIPTPAPFAPADDCVRERNSTGLTRDPARATWAGEDSNLRRLCRQIYSLLPLAARAPTPALGPHSSGDRQDTVSRHADFRRGFRGRPARGPQRRRPGAEGGGDPLRLQGDGLGGGAGRA